jgi:hypothetical protein
MCSPATSAQHNPSRPSIPLRSDKNKEDEAVFVFVLDALELATATPRPRPAVAAGVVDRQHTPGTL